MECAPSLVGRRSTRHARRVIAAVVLLTALAAADATDVERLARGDVLVSTEKVAGTDNPRAVVRAIIDAPPEKVWALVIECGDYQRTMPRILASTLVKREGSVDVCKVTTDMPFPLPDLTSTTRIERTVKDGVWLRTWKLIEGDFKVNEGSWKLTSIEGGAKTAVEYRILVEPNLPLPQSIAAAAQRKTLPDMIEGLRKRLAAQP